MTMTTNILLAITLGLAVLLPQGQSGQTKYQVILSSEVGIRTYQPSVLLTFTLPDNVDTEAPSYLLFKASGVELSFNRIYLNPQVPTPENPTCGFPDIRDPNDRYLLTYIHITTNGGSPSSYVLIRRGLLRPGINRLLICEDGNDDDEGLFDAFTVSQIILVYTITSEN